MRLLRTRIYVDGYNLYYGRLKRTPYKWLDIVALFEQKILPTVLYLDPLDGAPCTMELDGCAVKYFTATILESLSTNKDSVSSQAVYHNALRRHCADRVHFIMGRYSVYEASQHVISADVPKRQPRDCPKLSVWKIEEKQTDVNLALQAYDDALRGDIDQIVMVTNDTDLAPALAMIRARCPSIVVGLVIPTRLNQDSTDQEREANTSLSKHAHWTRRHITDEELLASQLPPVVLGGRRPAVKPDSWYPNPGNLRQLLTMAKPVLKGRGETMKWAARPNEYMQNQRPLDLIATDEGAQLVFSYIENYIAEQINQVPDAPPL